MALKQQFVGYWPATFGNSTTYKNPLISTQQYPGTYDPAQQTIVMPVAGTFRHLQARSRTAFAGVQQGTFTLLKNGVATALTTTVNLANQQAADVTNAIAVAAGDTLVLQRVQSGSPAARTYDISLEWEPSTADLAVYGWGNSSSNLGTATSHESIFAAGVQWQGTAEANIDIVAVAGALTELTAILSVAPGAGKSRIFTVIKNGVVQDGSGGTVDTRVTIADAATSATASFSISCAVLDRILIRHTVSGVPAVSQVSGVAAFQSGTAGVWNFSGDMPNGTSGTGGFYYPHGESSQSSTESVVEFLAPVVPIWFYGMTVALDAAPGVGKTWTFTLRKNAAGTAQTVTIADTDLVGANTSIGDAVALAPGDVYALQAAPTGSPSQTGGHRWTWAATATDPVSLVVNAGPDQLITIPVTSTTLAGSSSGFPATPDYLWTQTSGPAAVTFDDVTDPATDVTFIPAIGTYVLQLEASDADGSVTDTVTITLQEALDAEDCPTGAWGVAINAVDRTSMFKLEQVSIQYTLGSPGQLRCLMIDKGPPASAIRPNIGDVIIVTKGVRVFTGKIVATNETSLVGPNKGTGTMISAVDYQRALARRRFTKNYDPYAVASEPPEDGQCAIVTERTSNYSLIGSGAQTGLTLIGTVYPHDLVTGDRVTFTGVELAGPTINDLQFEVTVTTPNEFTIVHTLTTAGANGKVVKLVQVNTIFDDLLPFLAAYGITLNVEANGPWIVAPNFTLSTLEDVINYGCKLAEWVYRMTPYKVLQAFTPGTIVAPFELSIANANFVGPVPQARTRENYANALYVTGGKQGSPGHSWNRRMTWIGDGVTQVFPIDDPASWTIGANCTHPGILYIDGVPNPITGLYPGDPDEWTWDVSAKTLHHDGTAPAAGTSLEFVYSGPSNFITYVTHDVAIAAAGGEIEDDIWDAGEDATIATARALGKKELDRRVAMERRAKAETFECLVLPGTVIPVDNADRLMADEWLTVTTRMQSMDARRNGEDAAKYAYDLLEEGLPTTWVDFWKRR